MSDNDINFLEALEAVIQTRKGGDTDASYTAQLLAAGRSRIAQKVGEEAVELALASVQDDRPEVVREAADLVYHLMVLLQSHELRLADVIRELEDRHK